MIDDIPAPQGWIEFEVEDIDMATDTLSKNGYQLLVAKRENPGVRQLPGCLAQRDYWQD